uniref:POC1 centriolar protein homolog B n=1 Tax=Tetraodon nigroviridis TaxID=99883 RepID=H3C0W8_TETNG
MASVLEDPTLERHFTGHKKAVTCADFSPNHTQLASGSVDKTLMIWNLASKARSFCFIGHQDAITGVQFSPSGNLVATSSKDRTVRLWKPSIKGESKVIKAHTAAVRSVAFSYEGHKLVTASDDKSVKVWSVSRRCFLYSFNQHTNWVRCARFSPDERLIASCGDDRTIRLWDTSSKHCINCLTDYGGSATSVNFDFSGTCIASSGSDGSLKIWDLRTNRLIQHYQVHKAEVNSFSYHLSNNFMITGSSDSTVKILDLLEGRLIYTLHGHKGPVFTVAFSRDGDLFASGGADGQMLMWRTNFDTKPDLSVLQQHSRRSSPDPAPHVADIHSRETHFYHPKPTEIQILPLVPDTKSTDAQIIDSGLTTHSITEFRNSVYEGLASHVSKHTTSMSISRRKTHLDEVESIDSKNQHAHTDGFVHISSAFKSSYPPCLDSTLQHIVRQLDILTQTVSVLEERLTLTEDKLKECLQHQSQIIQEMGPRRRTGTEGSSVPPL